MRQLNSPSTLLAHSHAVLRPERSAVAAPRKSPILAIIRVAKPWLAALYIASIALVTVQRGVLANHHPTFPIFRQSFRHLVDGRDLYAAYPAEQGSAPRDRFKYSPTAALLFGPFALPPLPVGLLLWDSINAGALVLAFALLLRKRAATVAAAIALPFVFHAVQSSSSNGLVAALMIFAFIAAERGQQVKGAFLVVGGALIKIFPLSAATFALFRPRRLRFGSMLVFAVVVLVALPLLVTPPKMLFAQYGSWLRMLTLDEEDLRFGSSLMKGVRDLLRIAMPNWPVQTIGTVLLLVPVLRQRGSFDEPEFRRRFLCSLLVYSVIFNPQAEHPSFVIAAAGLAIWFATSRITAWRLGLMLACLVGPETMAFALVWLTMQAELLKIREREADAMPWSAVTRTV